MADKEIYLLISENADILGILNVVKQCCPDEPRVVPVFNNPPTWAVKLTIDKAADILDKGLDVNKFIPEEHDPDGAIQKRLDEPRFSHQK